MAIISMPGIIRARVTNVRIYLIAPGQIVLDSRAGRNTPIERPAAVEDPHWAGSFAIAEVGSGPRSLKLASQIDTWIQALDQGANSFDLPFNRSVIPAPIILQPPDLRITGENEMLWMEVQSEAVYNTLETGMHFRIANRLYSIADLQASSGSYFLRHTPQRYIPGTGTLTATPGTSVRVRRVIQGSRVEPARQWTPSIRGPWRADVAEVI